MPSYTIVKTNFARPSRTDLIALIVEKSSIVDNFRGIACPLIFHRLSEIANEDLAARRINGQVLKAAFGFGLLCMFDCFLLSLAILQPTNSSIMQQIDWATEHLMP